MTNKIDVEKATLDLADILSEESYNRNSSYPAIQKAMEYLTTLLNQAEEEKRPDKPTRWVSEPMTQKEAEIYVQGMYDLMMMVGCNGQCKHYDPLFFEGKTAHSYVLQLDDGGRHHSYITPQWVALKALLEFAQTLKDEWDIAGWNEYFAENTMRAIEEIEESTPHH